MSQRILEVSFVSFHTSIIYFLPIYTTVNSKTKWFELVIAIHVPYKIWSLDQIRVTLYCVHKRINACQMFHFILVYPKL